MLSCPLAKTRDLGGGLRHSLIDPPLHTLSRCNTKRSINGEHDQAWRCELADRVVRPRERLDVVGGWRYETVGEGLETTSLGNGVPVREDFWVLWDGGRRGGKLEPVLDLYVGMRCWGLSQEEKRDWGGPWHE